MARYGARHVKFLDEEDFKKIQNWRKRVFDLKMTMSNFCKTIEVPQTTMTCYLDGRSNPSKQRVEHIESKLKELEEANG